MTQGFKCPTCGAFIEHDGSEPVVSCPYCGSKVAVPGEVQAQPLPAQNPPQAAPAALANLFSRGLGGLLEEAQQLKTAQELARQGRQEEAAQILQQVLGVGPEDAHRAAEQIASGQPLAFSSTDKQFSSESETQVNWNPATGSAVPANRSRALWLVIAIALAVFLAGLIFFLMSSAPIR